MKQLIFLACVITTLLFGDDQCVNEKFETKEVFVKKYKHNVVVKKYETHSTCGFSNYKIEVFQNNKKIDSINEWYGADVLVDEDINNDQKREIILAGYSGGHGTTVYKFGTIEPNMKNFTDISGFTLEFKDIDLDGKKELIKSQSVFFCISSDFCCHACSLGIKIILNYTNNNITVNKQKMDNIGKHLQSCDIEVKTIAGKDYKGNPNKKLKFKDMKCAKYNLELLGHYLYSSNIKNIKDILNHFVFENQETKRQFMKKIIEDFKRFEFIQEEDKNKILQTLESY